MQSKINHKKLGFAVAIGTLLTGLGALYQYASAYGDKPTIVMYDAVTNECVSVISNNPNHNCNNLPDRFERQQIDHVSTDQTSVKETVGGYRESEFSRKLRLGIEHDMATGAAGKDGVPLDPEPAIAPVMNGDDLHRLWGDDKKAVAYLPPVYDLSIDSEDVIRHFDRDSYYDPIIWYHHGGHRGRTIIYCKDKEITDPKQCDPKDQIKDVPEPPAYILLLMGLGAVFGYRKFVNQ